MNSYSSYLIDLKKFTKGKRINKGGFGTIYTIEEKEAGKKYAAKIIDCGDDEEQCKQMIDREIGIMMYVNHSTIIKFIGFSLQDFNDENNVVIIMELAKNGSFIDVLHKIEHNDAPKDYTNTVRQIILVGIARGIKYLHDRNIIHRDIKAGNILLNENFYPLITDFGMSKVFDIGHSKSQSQCGGTLSYMAPEVIKDCPYDRKADVYSFGILMYEIVTDSVAYPDLENGKIKEYEFKNKVANENYRPEFKFPIKKSIKNLIEQCWSTNPDERPAFNEIFNKLTICINGPIDEINPDDDFLLDDIDMDEYRNYVEEISKESNLFEDILVKKNETAERENQLFKNKISNLQKENQKLTTELNDKNEKSRMCNNELLTNLQIENTIMKDNLSISTFNCFPLKMQNTILNDLITNPKDHIINPILKKANDLLIYMINLGLNGTNIIHFSIKDNHQYLTRIGEEKIDIILSYNAISFLFDKKAFESEDFINILTSLKNIIFNVQYPSDIFHKIDSFISEINQKNEKESDTSKDNTINFRLAVFISEIDSNLKGNNNIFEVTIEPSINKIAGGCFESCKKLTKVTLPDSIIIIGYNAFSECISLKQINLPPSLLHIESYAFRKCSSLEKIAIPNSVLDIGFSCFSECSSLKKVDLPPIKVIRNKLFYSCNCLKKVEIPWSVTLIEYSSFEGCISLKSITIPTELIEIQCDAFSGCSSLEKISYRFRPSLRKIGKNAFSHCNSLNYVYIPNSVNEIDDYAFGGCKRLYYARIPNGLQIGCAFTNRVEFFESNKNFDYFDY